MPGAFGGGGMSSQDIQNIAMTEGAINRNNTYSPIWGGTTWTQTGSLPPQTITDPVSGKSIQVPNPANGGAGGPSGGGVWTQTQTLSPYLQQRFDLANSLLGRVSADMQPVDWSKMTDVGLDPNYEQNQADQAFAFSKGYLDPQWNLNQQQMKGELAAQGLHPGDAAYNTAMNNFMNQRGQAYQQARSGAYQTGAQAGALREQTRIGALQAQIAEQLQKSGWSLNQINQLMAGMPGAPAGQAPASDLANMTLQNSLAQQQMQGNFWNNILGGGFMLGAGALARSDERAKEDFSDPAPAIEEFLEAAAPAEYSYKPEFQAEDGAGRYVSPMAQGLEKSSIGRSLVVETPTGKMVDYGKSFGALLGSLSHINKKLNSIMGL